MWSASWLRAHEAQAVRADGLSLFELMLRAGEAVFHFTRMQYPKAKHWLIVCGGGNNGGDGYVVARLCQSAGLRVTLVAAHSAEALPAPGCYAQQAWYDAGGTCLDSSEAWPEGADIMLDALAGTGLTEAPSAALSEVITRINHSPVPVIALDIPSGLLAETGTTPGAVVHAQHTVTFIALKPGLLTGKARDVTGTLTCAQLGLEHWLERQRNEAIMYRLMAPDLANFLMPRWATSHKGDQGRLLMIGGDHGTAGAIRLAGEGALRGGAGLVRVLTRAEHIGPLLTARPELMVRVLSADNLADSLSWADVIAIGPGLGQDSWGIEALESVKKSNKPMLWDADALNLLALHPETRHNRVITPHPGEAARLLACSVAEIEQDRVRAVTRLVKQYGGVVVLKGAGTLVASEQEMALIDTGNPGMASGGMGDVLSGIIAALMAQGLPLMAAASAGSVAHGAAADDLALRTGTRGMLASDLFTALYPFVNPDLNT